jgi:hypothetical protein
MNAVVEQPQTESAYDRLPRRHKRFVDEYVGGKTAAEALRSIGGKSRHARTVAWRLLLEPDIEAAVKERTAQVIADMGVKHEQVIREMYWLATCDPRKLVNGEGVQIPLHQLPADIAACISSVEIENVSYNDETGVRYKYRFWDKTKMLDKLGVYLKLWDTKGPTVNVDARSVTNNVIAASPEALSGAVRLLEQARAIAAPAATALGHSNGPLLPAAVRDEPAGRGTPVDAGKDSRSPGAT